jgi:RNA polymerase sigma factor (TIGR02999 family)
MNEGAKERFDPVEGQPEALDRLYALLYRELHQLARSRIRRSGEMTLLDTTSLVHEAYLRFGNTPSATFHDRGHFLAYAARVMRAIVVDAVRRRRALRNGGAVGHVEWDEEALADDFNSHDEEVIRVHESLTELAGIDPRLARVVEMRYFAGMTETEVAIALGMAVRTVARDWEKARLFLHATLR